MLKLYENIKKMRLNLGWTQEELAHRMGYSEKSMISRIESGKIDLSQSKIEDFAEVFKVTPGYLMGWSDYPLIIEHEIYRNQKEIKSRHTIHLLGRVAAGSPIFAEENIIGELDVPLEWSNNQEYYGLLIKGNSMDPQIKNNDVVIVHRQDSAQPGEIVIATINGDDAVCKKLMVYGETILLRSFNSEYDDIDVTGSDSFRIWGRVIEARHRF